MDNDNILRQAGLTEDQAQIYEALLDRGVQRASTLSKWTGIKRGLTYKTLEQLELMGLIKKTENKGSVATFSAQHPSNLMQNIERKEREIALSKEMVIYSLGSLVSKYNLLEDKPNIQFFEGIEGLNKLYTDIIAIKKNILLIQSPDDRNHPEIEKLIQLQIKRQVDTNIQTRAITPLVEDTKIFVEKYDEKNLVTRRIVKPGNFSPPAQIIVFGNKVGITSFEENMITTIIESESFSKTFESIFNLIWEKQSEEHEEIIASLGVHSDKDGTSLL